MCIITENIDTFISKSNKKNYWEGSTFERLLEIGPDERGEWGEKTVNDILIEYVNITTEWEGNQNTGREDNTVWDILINGYRTEVKTAMRGSTTTSWQHEKITEENCWEKLIFVDIDYNGIWFTVQNYGQIPYGESKHDITKTKSTYHLGGWKFDLSPTKIKKLKDKGYSFYHDINNPDLNSLSEFFNKHFN